MFTDEMLRLIAEEREREVRAALRVRRLLGPRRPWIRWHHRSSQRSSGQAAADRLR
jgi:hypothetical protein